MKDFKDIGLEYLSYGLCAVPLMKGEKRPNVFSRENKSNNWKQFQDRTPEHKEINSWNWSHGLGLLTGKASNSLEVLDFDNKGNIKAFELIRRFFDLVYEYDEKLTEKLVLERSPSGGFHLFYRCAQIEGNQKLAQDVNNEVLIETRGEGGFIVVAPSEGYELWNELDFSQVPTILPNERDLLIKIARTFDQKTVKEETEKQTSQAKKEFNWIGKTPFEAYNESDAVLDVLEKHSFSFPSQRGSTISVKRAGTKAKHSGYFFSDKRILYMFSTSTAFDAEKGYNPTGVFITLECNGDAKEAFKRLYAQGYGDRQPNNPKVSTERIETPPTKVNKQDIPVQKEYFERQYEFRQKVKEQEKKKKEEAQQKRFQKALAELNRNKFVFSDIPRASTPVFFVKTDKVDLHPVAAQGQLVAFVGKQKSRKTTALKAVLTSALSQDKKNCINFILKVPKGKNIVSIDTEQDRVSWHYSERRMLKQAGLTKAPNYYHSYNLRPYTKKTRLQLIEHLVKNIPNIGVLIIDGVVDICENFNDPEKSEYTIDKLLYWCSGDGRDILLFTVLHLNKGQENTLRGHLGTFLQNKANVVIEIEKNRTDPDFSSVICRDIRGKPFDPYMFTQNSEGYPVLDFAEVIEDPLLKKQEPQPSHQTKITMPRMNDEDIPF